MTPEMRPDQFTLDEANALIPWLSDKFRDLSMLQQQCAAIQKRMSDFHISTSDTSDPSDLKPAIEQLNRQIEYGIEEILDQGIIIRDITSGLVDFPSLRYDKDIYLCWIIGEERVYYWHEIDHGFSHRQPI